MNWFIIIRERDHCLIGEQEFSYERNHYVVIPPHTKHNDVHEENCKILCIGFTLDREEGEIPAGSYADENRNVMNYLKFVSAEIQGQAGGFCFRHFQSFGQRHRGNQAHFFLSG